MKPGAHRISMQEYLALPAVSASLLQTMVERCPAAARHESWLNPNPPEATQSPAAVNAGIAMHAIMEGSTACIEVIDPAQYPAKNGNIPDGWTNPAIRAARDMALAAGRVALLPDAYMKVEAMVRAGLAFIESLRVTEPAIWAAFRPEGGDSELTLCWDDRGVPCRIRPDRISSDKRLIVDLKSGLTSAEPNTWGRTQLVRMGYYVGAAFYRRGTEVVFGVVPDYVYLVIEQDPPHLCSLVGVNPEGLDLGSSKVRRGLDMWRTCLSSNLWPAYPNRVCYPELPPWEAVRWEEGHGGEQSAGIAYDPAKMWGDIFERSVA